MNNKRKIAAGIGIKVSIERLRELNADYSRLGPDKPEEAKRILDYMRGHWEVIEALRSETGGQA